MFQAIAEQQNVKRFALVIGNKNYASVPLKNALNDANAMANNLSELGFAVSVLKDGSLTELTNQVQQFYAEVASDLHTKKLAVFYYAGHALAINHQNYLVPLGMEFDDYSQFLTSLYKIETVFKQIGQSQGLLSIIILDACRNNPFEDVFTQENKSVANGLAPIKAPFNTMIAFATEPGGVASDGNRKNGVYTKHLLRHMTKQISVEEVFKKVRNGVAKETRNKQIPWEHSSLLNEVYFSPPKNRDVPDLLVF